MTAAPATALATSTDTLLNGRLTLRQPLQGLRAGLDAVFLAGALGPVKGTVLDAGAGHGTVGLSVAVRSPAARVTAVEIDPELAALARENAAANGLADRYTAIAADLLAPAADLLAAGLALEIFATVLSNPPFDVEGHGRPKRSARAAQAHAMPADGLERWARAWAAFCQPSGTLVVVHRADRLDALLAALAGRFGGLTILPLHPHDGEAAHRVLVRGTKGSRAPLTLLPGLVLHTAGGAWTSTAEGILAGEGCLFR